MEKKTCKNCHLEQDIERFYVASKPDKPGKPIAWCKTCCKIRTENQKQRRAAGLASPPRHDLYYAVWYQMVSRCHKENHKDYGLYGERGIKVCARWHSCDSFKEDMGPKPDRMSIDRVDTNKGYDCGKCEDCLARKAEPNCRWATNEEQARNKRNNRIITMGETSVTMTELAKKLQIPLSAIKSRVRRGISGSKLLNRNDLRRKNSRPVINVGIDNVKEPEWICEVCGLS